MARAGYSSSSDDPAWRSESWLAGELMIIFGFYGAGVRGRRVFRNIANLLVIGFLVARQNGNRLPVYAYR